MDRKISFRGRFLSQSSHHLAEFVIDTFSEELSLLGVLEGAQRKHSEQFLAVLIFLLPTTALLLALQADGQIV